VSGLTIISGNAGGFILLNSIERSSDFSKCSCFLPRRYVI
jgi:hypothetical protein